LPLEFPEGTTRKTLQLTGAETIDIVGLSEHLKPRMIIKAIIHREDGSQTKVDLHLRIDTLNELDYYQNDGILQYMIRHLLKNKG